MMMMMMMIDRYVSEGLRSDVLSRGDAKIKASADVRAKAAPSPQLF